MSKHETPARTYYTCDRCGDACDDSIAKNLAGKVVFSDAQVHTGFSTWRERTFDYCATCTALVRDFLESAQ